jgi:hypothetical protein
MTASMTTARVAGRGWAYVGALLGGVVSVAANVAHSYVPPAGAPVGWTPHLGAVVGAVFWPVAVFVAVEIFARTPWASGSRWVALRWLGLLPVALVAAVVSYRHLSGLLVFYREDALTATLGPLAVDGLMVMATGALIATAGHRTAATPVTAPVPVPAGDTAPAVDTPAARAPDDATATTTPAAKAPYDATTATATAAPGDATPATRPSRPRTTRRSGSADRVAKAAARMPGATAAAIAAKAEVSESTARRYLRNTIRPDADTTVASAAPARPANPPIVTDAAAASVAV